jgi:hypothetical protein
MEARWVEGALGWSYYSCLRREYDNGPTWVAMEVPELEAYVSTHAAHVHSVATLDTTRASTTTNILIAQPDLRNGADHWHLDRMAVYLYVSRAHTRSARDHVDVVAHDHLAHVWRVADLLHATLHHLPGTTAEAMKHVAMWVPYAMNHTMRIYGFHCANATIEYNAAQEWVDPVHPPEQAFAEVGVAADAEAGAGAWQSMDPPSGAPCADMCGDMQEAGEGEGKGETTGCVCKALRCTTERLVAHGSIECSQQPRLPHTVWHVIVESS